VSMELLYPRCAGLDLHKDSVVARVRCVTAPVHDEVRTFGTTTSELIELGEWMKSHQVSHVAMEATGVYWKPVWHILEEDFLLVLANAAHIKNVPGRKTDVNDATWIAELLAHGLIRSSFVPPPPIQELRDVTRERKQLVREVVQHSTRIQKILEDANIKLGSVLSDVLGKSGTDILNAIVKGESDPEKLANLAVGNARKKRAALVEALRGRIRDHHRKLLKMHLTLVKAVQEAIADLDAILGKSLATIQAAVRLLATIPGVSDVTAYTIVATIGLDMSRFPTDAHLRSWACICPRNEESAGKRRSTRVRVGGNWLKTALITAAWAATRVKGSYFHAQFHRLKARRGAKKAILAVASSMLTTAYHMLKNGDEYQDLGADHFVQRDRSKIIGRLVKRLNDLGCEVTLAEAA
jgi:transposase